MYGRNPEQLYLQDQAMEWLPRILGAITIFIIAYILARAAKWGVAKIVDKVPALRRHNEGHPTQTVGSLIGDIAFWLILLVGILLALQPLGLSEVLEPVRELTTNTFAFIPNIIAAGLIFFIGLVIAKIVRRITEGALLAANADAWLRKTGLIDGNGNLAAEAPATEAPAAPAPRTASISRSVGLVVFFLIMIPVTIAALEALHIQSISGPATEMLRTILDAIPNVLGAAALIAIGFFVGRLAKAFVEQVLPSMGFDRAVGALGFSPENNTPSRTVGTV
ncbi:MAG TPA: mechanosensitive ion channel, partial [Allosphingosinicella sp.]